MTTIPALEAGRSSPGLCRVLSGSVIVARRSGGRVGPEAGDSDHALPGAVRSRASTGGAAKPPCVLNGAGKGGS